MFVLTELRRELRRSKRIVNESRETSQEFRRQYHVLDEKYKLTSERCKLERIPHVRKSIIRNFVKDLNEVRENTQDSDAQRKYTVQRFLNKLTSIHNSAVQE